MSDITFKVIDTECQTADRSFFPPRILLTTKSTTKIATVRGYSEYIASSPPKKYKSLTWNGYSTHSFWVNGVGTGTELCKARYDYFGTGQIDLSGNQISDYEKLLSSFCVEPNTVFPKFLDGAVMIGWCNPPDGLAGIGCTECDQTLKDGGDWSTNRNSDFSTLAHFDGSIPSSSFSIVDSTNGLGSGTGQLAVEIGNPLINVLLPPVGRGYGDTLGICTWDNNYSSVMTDEYTDAEALANAVVIVSNGATAENKPRTTGFVSRFTSVVYTLTITNLIVDESYLVTVNFRDQNYAPTLTQFGFTATAITKVIINIVPTPSVGGTLTVVSATIGFLP